MSTLKTDVYVTVTGPALSLLLYETTKSAGNQMGFLVGTVINQLTNTISDSEISSEKKETSINISSIAPSSVFFDNAGRIDKKKISTALHATEQSNEGINDNPRNGFVGWYCFNRNSTFRVSMRENVIHRQLCQMAQSFAGNSTPDIFVLCLLSSNVNKPAHVFKHSFMRYLSHRQSFEVIPLQVHNLGLSQKLSYQVRESPPQSAVMRKILSDCFGQGNCRKAGMLMSQTTIQKRLSVNASSLFEIERCRMKLEDEVEELRSELESKLRKAPNLPMEERCSAGPVGNESEPFIEGDSEFLARCQDGEPSSPVLRRSTGRGQSRGNEHVK